MLIIRDPPRLAKVIQTALSATLPGCPGWRATQYLDPLLKRLIKNNVVANRKSPHVHTKVGTQFAEGWLSRVDSALGRDSVYEP